MDVTIDPGVTIIFAEDGEFDVGNELTARGTADRPIVFTSEKTAPGSWNGVVCRYDCRATLEYVTIERGGASGGANLITYPEDGTSLSMSNCTIRDSAGYGIGISPNTADANALASSNKFSNNAAGNILELAPDALGP